MENQIIKLDKIRIKAGYFALPDTPNALLSCKDNSFREDFIRSVAVQIQSSMRKEVSTIQDGIEVTYTAEILGSKERLELHSDIATLEDRNYSLVMDKNLQKAAFTRKEEKLKQTSKLRKLLMVLKGEL